MSASITCSAAIEFSGKSFVGDVAAFHNQVVQSNVAEKAQQLSFIQKWQPDLLREAKKEMGKEKKDMIQQWMDDNNLEYIPGKKPLMREKGSGMTLG